MIIFMGFTNPIAIIDAWFGRGPFYLLTRFFIHLRDRNLGIPTISL